MPLNTLKELGHSFLLIFATYKILTHDLYFYDFLVLCYSQQKLVIKAMELEDWGANKNLESKINMFKVK